MKIPGRLNDGDTRHATLQPPGTSEPRICPKCTGIYGAHFLTCPALRLPRIPLAAGTQVTR